MQEATFDIEKQMYAAGYALVVGIDEAGRGPLAGPVVAAAAAYRDQARFVVPPDLEKTFRFVRDSKTLSEKKREEMYDFVRAHFVVGVGIVSHETIDRINILEATFLAMKEAVGNFRRAYKNENKNSVIPARQLSDKHPTGIQISETTLDPWVTYPNRSAKRCGREPEDDNVERMLLLVDGNMTIPNLSIDQEAVVGGDALSRSIAAASIIAKVTRDRMMLEYDKDYPVYGFAQHKGYGTKMHMDALRKHGACPIHRMSFKPVFYSIPENVNRNLLSRKK
jgi:ribonuclease HII